MGVKGPVRFRINVPIQTIHLRHSNIKNNDRAVMRNDAARALARVGRQTVRPDPQGVAMAVRKPGSSSTTKIYMNRGQRRIAAISVPVFSWTFSDISDTVVGASLSLAEEPIRMSASNFPY